MNFVKFIEYSRKCNRGNYTCYKNFKFSIQLFDAITGEYILENREDFACKCFRCKTINTINFNKVCNKGIMNLIYQKIVYKNMGINEMFI